MDQDINVKLFLKLDDLVDFLFNGLHIFHFWDPAVGFSNKTFKGMNIVGIRKNPFFLTQINIRKVFQTPVAKDHPLVCLVFTTHSPEIHCLRERPNGGGWENWKVQLLLLCIQPCTDIGSSTMVRALQSSSLSKKKVSFYWWIIVAYSQLPWN